jgi:hypothetical protein
MTLYMFRPTVTICFQTIVFLLHCCSFCIGESTLKNYFLSSWNKFCKNVFANYRVYIIVLL